jgi:predicted GIY-YIG superfamily endonuclease
MGGHYCQHFSVFCVKKVDHFAYFGYTNNIEIRRARHEITH